MKEPKDKRNFGIAPWMLKKGEIDEFTRVTPENRKQAIVIGRILYVMEPIDKYWQFNGAWSVDPLLERAWWRYPFKPWEKSEKRHFRVFVYKDMKYEDWKDSNKALIDMFVAKQMLFIRTTDPILQYFKEDKT